MTLNPEYGFVIEDDMGVCGYAVAALDAHELAKKVEVAWLPSMREKYCAPEKKDCCSPAEVAYLPFLKWYHSS